MQAEFHFDDYHNIVDNKNIQITALSWEEIKGAFYSPRSPDRINRPLAYFSFALNYYFSGLDTTDYHLVNIAIHFICTIFVYLVFLRTLLIYYNTKENPPTELFLQNIALLGAIFWAVHPIQIQAVTYIVQRMASMAAMFYMMSFYCYLRFRTSPDGSNKMIFILLTLLSLFLGLLSKENIVVFPLAVFAYEITFFNLSLQRYAKNILLLLAGLLVITAIAVFLTYEDFKIATLFSSYDYRPFTMWQRLITQPIVISRYLLLIFYPAAGFFLTLTPDLAASKNLLDPPITLFANLFIITLPLLSVLFLRRLPILCFAVLFYFINHLVESTILPLELYFEHRNYLPSIFIYFALSFYFLQALSYAHQKRLIIMRSLLAVAVIAFVISECMATYQRNSVWKTEISFWEDAVTKAPLTPRSHNNLAAAYEKAGRTTDAIEEYVQAISVDSNYAIGYNNLGKVYGNLGRYEDAIRELRRAVELVPDNFEPHYNLCVNLEKMGRLDDALRECSTAARLNPGHVDSLFNLGKIFDKQGRFNEAVQQYRLAVGINPGLAGVHNNLGIAYSRIGQTEAAIQEISRAIQLDPNITLAHNNLGILYGKSGQIDKAINEFLMENQINPEFDGAYYNLGIAYKMQGRIGEAIGAFNQALTLNPANSRAKMNLELLSGESAQFR